MPDKCIIFLFLDKPRAISKNIFYFSYFGMNLGPKSIELTYSLNIVFASNITKLG